nr:carbohydrate ABC transporter permease [uncultured Sphaerochaeta sp.]
MMKAQTSNYINRILTILVLLFLCFIVLAPFGVMGSYSIRTENELYDLNISFFPKKPTLDAYYELIANNELLFKWIFNSLYVTVTSTLLVIIFSAMMAYAIANFRFHGRKGLWFIIAMTQSIPWIIPLIPLYIMLSNMDVLDSLNTVMIVYTACFIPTSVWLMVGFFKKIPKDISEAARIDGCSNWGVLLRIIIPLSTNALCAIGLTAFIGGWGDYVTVTTIIRSKEVWTLPIAIQSLKGPFYTAWTQIMALGTIVSVPVVIIFLWLQKYLVNLLAGGVKE